MIQKGPCRGVCPIIAKDVDWYTTKILCMMNERAFYFKSDLLPMKTKRLRMNEFLNGENGCAIISQLTFPNASKAHRGCGSVDDTHNCCSCDIDRVVAVLGTGNVPFHLIGASDLHCASSIRRDIVRILACIDCNHLRWR